MSHEYSDKKVAVIIPCYKESSTITAVIKDVPNFVHKIIVVDDKCPEGSGKLVENLSNERVEVICHDRNLGVGGAVKSGYKKALELGCDFMVKIDGDGQMDTSHLERLLEPITSQKADYTKGNRFQDFLALKDMPKIRLIGNSVLSFMVKISSGYWHIFDPTNGYTAISRTALTKIDFDKLVNGFFFETDMLIRLNIARCVVKDVAIPAIYPEASNSSLSILKVLRDFPFKIVQGFLKRIFYRYFIYDFNMASIYLLLGLPMFMAGIILGTVEWIESINTGIPRTAGTIMLLALPIIIGFQMLLQAVSIDIDSIPVKNDT